MIQITQKGSPKKKVAVFIDGSNLHHAQKVNGWRIRFEKLKKYFMQFGELIGLYYFTPSPPFHQTEIVKKYRNFKKALIYLGYTVKDKELKEIKTVNKNGQVKILKKANLDPEMIWWMSKTSRDFDIAIIIAGDSDFAPILEDMITQGKYIIVIANQNNTALEIQNIAHKFIDLRNLKKDLS